MQPPSFSLFVTILLENIFADLADGMPQSWRNCKDDDVEGSIKLVLIDALTLHIFIYYLHCLILHLCYLVL